LLGNPRVRHHVRQCPHCHRVYRCERLGELVPAHGRYAFDLIVAVGLARFCRHQQNEEIREQLRSRFGLDLPLSTISHLAHTFLDCLAAVHDAKAQALRARLDADGGYALHVDGTCEAGTEIIFAALDGRRAWVLASTKISTENALDITQFVRRCVARFGLPISAMRDLSKNIGDALKAAIPEVMPLVCHYHFLLTVGTRLCKEPYRRLTERLRELKLRPALKSLRSELVKCSKTAERISQQQILRFLQTPQSEHDLDAVQLRRFLAYALLCWLEDYGADMKGEYFPFDLPELTFHRRCLTVHRRLEKLLDRHDLQAHQFQTFQTLRAKLASAAEDAELLLAASRLEKAEVIFNELRTVLSLNPAHDKPLLRQSSPPTTLECALGTETRLTAFRTRLEGIVTHHVDADESSDAQVILNYLDKYGKQLVGHAIVVEGRPEPILVPRTNNPSEHCFAHRKQHLRRKSGLKTLTRCVQAMRPEELLVANINQPSYLDALYGGSLDNMATVFAEHAQQGQDLRKQRRRRLSSHPMPLSKKELRDDALLDRIETGMDTLLGSAPRSRPAA
jgi:hypothetical protein